MRIGGNFLCLAALATVAGIGGGSNNWAIAASRTATGRPILANDPHLAPLLPPHWYLAHLATPQWSLVGASFPGAPVVAAGHNGHAAWGVTSGQIDYTDLFLEELGPDGRSVRRGDVFVPCEVIPETIEVGGGDDEHIDVLVTDRGPIIGPALEGAPAVSMSATWFCSLRLSAVRMRPKADCSPAMRSLSRRKGALLRHEYDLHIRSQCPGRPGVAVRWELARRRNGA